MMTILKMLGGLLAAATEFIGWRREVRRDKRNMAADDALTEDLDSMDDAILDGDLKEMGRLVDELDDPRPETRGVDDG